MDNLEDYTPTIPREPEEVTMADADDGTDADDATPPRTEYEPGDTMSDVQPGAIFGGSSSDQSTGPLNVHWNSAMGQVTAQSLTGNPAPTLSAGFAQTMTGSVHGSVDGELPTIFEEVRLMPDFGPIFGLLPYDNMSVALAAETQMISAPSSVPHAPPTDSTEDPIWRRLAKKLLVPSTHSLSFTKSQDGTLRCALRDATRPAGMVSSGSANYFIRPVLAFQHMGNDTFAVSSGFMYDASTRGSGVPMGGTMLRQHLNDVQRSGRPSMLANIMAATETALVENPEIGLTVQTFCPFRPELSVQALHSWSHAVSSSNFFQSFNRARKELSRSSQG